MSQEIFEKNLTAMEKWYPSFADMVRKREEAEESIQVCTEKSWDGETIFRVQKGGRKLYLAGKRNAKTPVQTWMERMGEFHKKAPVFLFGLGSGNYLKAVVQNTKPEVNVVAYEPSPDIFLAMLREIDLSQEIQNRPIAFIVNGINETEYKPVMDKVLDVESLPYLKEEVHSNYREFFGEELVTHVKLLHRKAEDIKVRHNTGKLYAGKFAQNVFGNMKYICEGYNTQKLAEAIPLDGPAILVSAGPSLDKNIHELKKAKNKAFILAVDSAVKPLLKAGVVPDAFITIDPNKPLKLLDAEGAENIPVVAATSAHYPLLERQKGKKIFYNDGYGTPLHIYKMNGKQFQGVSTGGSVACNGLSLLYKMGFNTMILVGQDLAYTGNKSYVSGSYEEKSSQKDTRNMIRVKGNVEDGVPTTIVLRIYLEWFARYVKGMKEHYNVRVINATEGGAYIDGTEIMALRDAIEETCQKEVDFEGCISRMESEFTVEERKKAAEYLHTIPEKYGKLAESARMLGKEYRKLGEIAAAGHVDVKKCRKQFEKIKKLTTECGRAEGYQMVEMTMPSASYILRSEFFYEGDSPEEEIREAVRKGMKYSELLETCAELLKELTQETLLPIEA